MSRGMIGAARATGVWVLATSCTLGALHLALGACAAVRVPSPATGAAPLLVAVCSGVLALALSWLWVITTVTVLELASGRARSGGGATRRLVLLACGAAVVAGVASPAAASGGDRADLLDGLALPERALAPSALVTTAVPRAPATGPYVVRAGDSLWSIAREHPGPPGTSTEQRWHDIWHDNRAVVGADPDLIHPGQALRLPDTHQSHHQDGDR